MRICVITPDYPDSRRCVFTFVKQLVDEWATQGHQCYVIAPFSVTHNRRFAKYKEVQSFNGGGKVVILRPNIPTFSTFKIGSFDPTMWITQLAIDKVFKSIVKDVDCVYCHFWISGIWGYNVAKDNNLPLFVATGESEIPIWLTDDKYSNFYKYLSGVVCVSSKNRDESIRMGLTEFEKCKVFPNAINPDLFKPKDKVQCRRVLGFPDDAFIVISVGWFNERKGVRRIASALNLLKDNTIHSVFIGNGPDEPHCENILFKGRVAHDKIPLYLNASDVFVLPTLHEGCCNAVVEAMSCGLPVVSSDLPFNHDVLNSTNSIMVNPTNIEEIANAIKELRYNKDQRKELAQGAVEASKELNISTRAQRIANFLNDRL